MKSITTVEPPPESTSTTESESVVSTKPRREKIHSTFAPVAYNESVMPALRLVRSSRKAKLIGRILLVMLLLAIVLMALAPWQQSVRGNGRVLAYSPQARQQVIESRIKGRIVNWGEGVYENARVTEGQMIVEIADLDPDLIPRLKDQLEASKLSVAAERKVTQAAANNLETAIEAEKSYQQQLIAYRTVKEQIVAAAEAYVEVAKERLKAEQQNLLELEAGLDQEEADYLRQKQLFEERIVSKLNYQIAERKLKESQAKVAKAKAFIEAAKEDVKGKQQERDAKEQKAQVDIDEAEAKLQKARGEIAKAESELSKAESNLNKAIKELSEMETKLSRQQSQIVTAPLDGYLLNLVPNLGGALVKEGDPICAIVPDTEDRAVELWLLGNDIPLVQAGDHVRLQFEGWPAVQFSGWPSVAVGTFGGEVISVDQTDDGRGLFRCLVLPDEYDDPWPEERFLRQGVRANGWVLLKQVPLWYEMWRRFNGFPLVVDTKEGGGKSSKSSRPSKLVKPK
jgi:multidrug resistance efflux pump